MEAECKQGIRLLYEYYATAIAERKAQGEFTQVTGAVYIVGDGLQPAMQDYSDDLSATTFAETGITITVLAQSAMQVK